ncbi:protein TALPID3 isoform X6 [Xyrichtys novacula]|uniref:Protein TALPID3 isoform X6 n=1 Tax=Xyrichtys novacula TaxID=13765 RepID=A0AAV1GQS4_XYRNO|nr:protein TALPID3 isoform X6 [Xyrichtys novacula]
MWAQPDSPRALFSPVRSSSSSDTGEVLIRSTRAQETTGSGSVRITVQKLKEVPVQPPLSEQQQWSSGREERLKPRGRPEREAPERAGGPTQPDRQTLHKPGPTKENREPSRTTPSAAETRPHRTPSAAQDVLTSRFDAGGRDAMLAALKQRSHSAPHRREVKVQLLDPGLLQTSSQGDPVPTTGSQDAVGVSGVQMEAGLPSGSPGDASVTAAAVPLFRAQSHLEARVCRLADGVEKLLQADREGGDRGRSLTLHHLEKLHSQQLQFQCEERGRGFTLFYLFQEEDSLKTAKTGPDPHETQQNQPQLNPLQSQSKPVHYQQDLNLPPQSSSQQSRPQTQFTVQNPETQQVQSNPIPVQQTQSQPVLPQSQTQQSRSQQTGPRQNQFTSQQTPPQPVQSKPNPTHQNHLQPLQSDPQQTQSRTLPSSSHQTGPQQNQSHSHLQTHQSIPVQRRPVIWSTLDEAGQVLRQVRKQKKVLEENLGALLRTRTGEVLNCQLEALAANRDWTEEVRIKKTVDAWIRTLSKDIQDEISVEKVAPCRSADAVSTRPHSQTPAVTSQRAAGASSAHSGRGRPLGTLRGTTSKTARGRGSRGQTGGQVQWAEPVGAAGRLSNRTQVEDESYLAHLYGRALYEGSRRTLKKSPYLRLSSPVSPVSRKLRPRVVESVRGVKVKSCKTQTCLAPPPALLPGRLQRNDHMTSGDPDDHRVTATDGQSVPMAIPLGRPRMDSSSRCLYDRQQEVTSPPMAPPTSAVAAVEEDRSPELQSQEQQDTSEAPPPPSVDIMEVRGEEEVEEEVVFPGTDFLSVTDVIQEVRAGVEVELDGGPSPPPVLYQGPVFPPQVPPTLPLQDQAPLHQPDLQRDLLETRLVEWVEQQLMSRIISQMYRPPLHDPAQNGSPDQSEHEDQSVTSDIIEAAGGSGLQFFVDSDVLVDSALIRQLVSEVLSEQITLILGRTDTQGPEPEPEPPGPEAHQEDELVSLVPTPVPTPPSSPTTEPNRETTPMTTPPPSEPTSLQIEEPPQPITEPEPVATPTPSPEPAHSPESPHVGHQAPPLPAPENTELLLDEEERSEEHLDTHLILASAAVEEPRPLSPPRPAPSPPPPGPGSSPASRSSSSEESSSSQSSSPSSSSVETEAALRHISEGELLITINQLTAAAAAITDPVHSFSSSLQEIQEDLDFDPPSVGQVRGHDILKALLTKMEEHRGERPQPEGSWGREEEEEVSVGEVREDWTTKHQRTTIPRSLSRSTAAQRGQTSSPGQISRSADVSSISFEGANQGSVAVGDFIVEPIGALTSDLQTDQSPPHLKDTHTVQQVFPVRVSNSGEQQGGGARSMEVYLPSITPQEEEEHQEEYQEEVMEECLSAAAADSDSSVSDRF